MQRLECPIGDCTAVFEAETDDEVMSEVSDHAAEHHPDMEMTDDVVADLRSQIKTV